MKRLRRYLPNTSTKLALVSLDDERPFRAYWPMRFTQLLGGKRWSISVCVFRTETPVRIEEEFYGKKAGVVQ